MKKVSIFSVLAVTVLVIGFFVATGTALAANPLLCFADLPGTCSISSSSGVATLDNTGGGDSGVYTAVSSLTGKMLAQVDQLSFNYTGIPTGGAPRISLPIDTDANGTRDGYAFIGANLCNDGAGLVNAIHDTTCDVNYLSVDYPNWTAFVAAFSSAKVGPGVPFVIADEAGLWTVSNVHLGSDVVASVPMAINSSLPTFTAGVEAPFSVSTVANGDAGKMVRAYFTIPTGASVTYQEQDGLFYPLTNVYGPETGFPVSDLTSNFKATFASAGTYTVTVDFKLLNGTVVATKEITATVVAASSVTPPTNKDQCKKDGWKTFTNSFKNQGQCVSFVEKQKDKDHHDNDGDNEHHSNNGQDD